jgi:hypothetical protein
MYPYIGNAIALDNVHLDIGDGHSYDPHNNTITFDSLGVNETTIVHEATHALIDATHRGQSFTTGVHETTAYLAETIYALNVNDTRHQIDVPHVQGRLESLAGSIRAFNAQHNSGLFVCPAREVADIIAILGNSGLHQNMDHCETMDGINEEPHRGLLGQMILDSRKKKWEAPHRGLLGQVILDSRKKIGQMILDSRKKKW